MEDFIFGNDELTDRRLNVDESLGNDLRLNAESAAERN